MTFRERGRERENYQCERETVALVSPLCVWTWDPTLNLGRGVP